MEQVDVFSSVGNQFQALGAANEKALSPNLRRVRGVVAVGGWALSTQWPNSTAVCLNQKDYLSNVVGRS